MEKVGTLFFVGTECLIQLFSYVYIHIYYTHLLSNVVGNSNVKTKSLLFNQEQTWMKKGSDLFDVSMGAYDGAEVCELISIFLLNLLERQYDAKNIGLCRDDGLSILKNCSGP